MPGLAALGHGTARLARCHNDNSRLCQSIDRCLSLYSYEMELPRAGPSQTYSWLIVEGRQATSAGKKLRRAQNQSSSNVLPQALRLNRRQTCAYANCAALNLDVRRCPGSTWPLWNGDSTSDGAASLHTIRLMTGLRFDDGNTMPCPEGQSAAIRMIQDAKEDAFSLI